MATDGDQNSIVIFNYTVKSWYKYSWQRTASSVSHEAKVALLLMNTKFPKDQINSEL
jgi:hypothetical protein